MPDRISWSRGWRGIVLIIIGVVMGANLIAPAVAHVGGTINHLWSAPGHIRAKVRAFGDARWLNNNEVMARGATSDTAINDFTSATFTSIISTTITAPKNGFLFIVGSLSVEDDASLAGSADLNFRLRLDSTPVWDSGEAYELDTDQSEAPFNLAGAANAVVPVSAGSHTVHLDAQEAGTGSFIEGRSISVLFVPTGSGTVIPASAGSADRSQNHAGN